jgi:hypothetical protein
MGRRSKATTARINNLQKSTGPRNATVEDVFNDEDVNYEQDDDLLDEGFFFLDDDATEDDSDDCDSEDDEVDEDKLESLQNEAAIEHFNAVLREAQALAVKAEREAAGERKRKRHYSGNSERTKRYHAQKRRELATTGQKLISSMFSKKRRDTTHVPEGQKAGDDILEIVDDSDCSDDEENDVQTSVKRLFPQEQVSL